jgi:DNA-binding NarL/FixJ family response regulator
VATRLGISPPTVGTYCKRLFEKLQIRRAIELGKFSLDGAGVKPSRRVRRVIKA